MDLVKLDSLSADFLNTKEIKTTEFIFVFYYINNIVIGLKITMVASSYRINGNAILKDLRNNGIKESSINSFAFRLKGSNDGPFYQVYAFKLINGIIYANTTNFTLYDIQ